MVFNFDQLVSIIFTIGMCNVAVMLAGIMKCMITTPVVDGLSFYFLLLGTAWEVVSAPHMSRELGLLQVSAGLNSVWALTKDGQVIHNYGRAITYLEIVGVEPC